MNGRMNNKLTPNETDTPCGCLFSRAMKQSTPESIDALLRPSKTRREVETEGTMSIKTSHLINQQGVQEVHCRTDHVLKRKRDTKWQCQETIALLTIRSKMGSAIRGNHTYLWEDVSRQLAEQGYTKTPKQCFKKFDNIRMQYNKYVEEGRADFQDKEIYHFFSQLKALHSRARASTTINRPILTGRVSSGKTQSPPSDLDMPTSIAAATTQIAGSQVSCPDSVGGLHIWVPGSVAVNNELTTAEIDCRQLLHPTREEHRSFSLCLKKLNCPVSGGIEDEACDMTVVQIDHTQMSSSTVEERQALSLGVEDDKVDNQLLSNDAINLTHASTKNLEPLQSSDEVKRSFRLEAKGDERALQSSFDVTANKNSFLGREDEGPLPLIDIRLPLPFIKNSHLWGNFESMEIFQLMPQLPHFHPLEKENEELREGIALGHMLSFASLKDKTCKAHIEDSRSTFENKLNALTVLEELGFSVQLIRSHLEELLRIKDHYDQLDDKSKAAEGEIRNEKRQVDKIEDSITQLNMQLQELLMEKERKGFNIDELQRMADLIEEKLQSERLEFDNLVAASW